MWKIYWMGMFTVLYMVTVWIMLFLLPHAVQEHWFLWVWIINDNMSTSIQDATHSVLKKDLQEVNILYISQETLNSNLFQHLQIDLDFCMWDIKIQYLITAGMPETGFYGHCSCGFNSNTSITIGDLTIWRLLMPTLCLGNGTEFTRSNISLYHLRRLQCLHQRTMGHSIVSGYGNSACIKTTSAITAVKRTRWTF